MYKNTNELFNSTIHAADQMWRTQAQRAPRRQEKQQKRSVYHQCSYCGKKNEASLRACAVCKAVRYCNKECQVADYKTRHRDECRNFAQPPFTTAFMTEPVGTAQHPSAPIFAAGHREGVGCWVSIHGGADIRLQFPLTPVLWAGGSEDAVREQILTKGNPAEAQRYGSYTRSLLTLRILVQNRRKDKATALVFAGQAQAVSHADDCVELVQMGRTEGERSFTFQSYSGKYAAMLVPEDPWDKKLRLAVLNFNGTDLSDPTKPAPAGVVDRERGILALGAGEYAIVQLQFRVGNGKNIRKDYEALFCIQGLSVPLFTPFPPASGPGSEPNSGLTPAVLEESIVALWDSPERAPLGIHTFLDQEAVQEYYADALEAGDRAFMERHHGRARAEEWEGRSRLMIEHAQKLLQFSEGCGDGPLALAEILRECEKAGVRNTARSIEIIRSGKMPDEWLGDMFGEAGARSW